MTRTGIQEPDRCALSHAVAAAEDADEDAVIALFNRLEELPEQERRSPGIVHG